MRPSPQACHLHRFPLTPALQLHWPALTSGNSERIPAWAWWLLHAPPGALFTFLPPHLVPQTDLCVVHQRVLLSWASSWVWSMGGTCRRSGESRAELGYLFPCLSPYRCLGLAVSLDQRPLVLSGGLALNSSHRLHPSFQSGSGFAVPGPSDCSVSCVSLHPLLSQSLLYKETLLELSCVQRAACFLVGC